MNDLIARYASDGIFVIAEGGTSHGGDLAHAEALIAAAAAAGASAIKFQVIFADEILHPQCGELLLVGKQVDLYTKFKSLERPPAMYAELKRLSERHGLLFLASCFGRQSAALLEEIGVAAHKIASPELNYYPLWRELLATGKPIFASTGMSKSADLIALFTFLKRWAAESKVAFSDLLARLNLLQCMTCYPAPAEEYNLLTLLSMSNLADLTDLTNLTITNRAKIGDRVEEGTSMSERGAVEGGSAKYARAYLQTGLSDHSLDPFELPVIALILSELLNQPFVLEKHLTLTKTGAGLDDPIALTSDELKDLLQVLRSVKKSLQTVHRETIRLGQEQILAIMKDAYGWMKNGHPLDPQKGFDVKNLEIKPLQENVHSLVAKVLEACSAEIPNLARLKQPDRLKNILGTGVKTLSSCEKPYYTTTNRSLLALRDITAGELLSETNSGYLRAEQGNLPGLTPEWEEATESKDRKRSRFHFRTRQAISNGAPILSSMLE